MQATTAIRKKKQSKLAAGAIFAAALLGFGVQAHAQRNRSIYSRFSNITVNPNAVNFGRTKVGNASNPVPVTLHNYGKSSITVSQVSLSLLQVSYSGPALPVTIPAGQSMTASVSFVPNSAQTYRGTLSFKQSNGQTVSTNLSGVGLAVTSTPPPTTPPTTTPTPPVTNPTPPVTPPVTTPPPPTTPAPAVLALGASSVTFGSVNVGTTVTKNVTVSNTGGSNLNITAVSVTGAGFNASGLSGAIILPGSSATLTVSFDPAASGNAAGTVSITSSASGASVSLSGSGAAAPVAHTAQLNWSVDPAATTGYNVYGSMQSGGPYTKKTTAPVASTGFTDSGVQSGQTYFYVVTAIGANSTESGYSNEVSAAIP